MLLSIEEETKHIAFNQPNAIAIAANPTINSSKLSKLKVNNIVNKRNRKRKQLTNYNPLLPESEKISEENDNDSQQQNASKPTRIHSFELITKTSKTNVTKKSKISNIYCMLLFSNVFLIGSFLLFIHNYIIDAIGILFIVIGFLLNIYTVWKFCGHRICPRFYKHENKLIFNDNDKKIYIHWNSLIKQSTIKYDEFARLYVEQRSGNNQYGIVFIATTQKHYRFNKYLSNIKDAKEFVNKVNNWFHVLRLEQKERQYNNYSNTILIRNNKYKAEEKEEEIKKKTKGEMFVENEMELNKLIKKLKYKSFAERDIENACRLKEFFDSKFKKKMVEEYENIKMDLERKRNERNDKSQQFIFENENKYIVQALLLKFDTLDKLIEKRKMDKIQMFINENNRNKIVFDQNEEEKCDTLEDEQKIYANNINENNENNSVF